MKDTKLLSVCLVAWAAITFARVSLKYNEPMVAELFFNIASIILLYNVIKQLIISLSTKK